MTCGAAGIGSLAGCLRLTGDERETATDDRTDDRTPDADRIELREYNDGPIDVGHPAHREVRRESDRLVLHAGDVNADPEDIEGEMVEDEVSLGTVGVDRRIDLTAVNEIRIEYRHRSEGGRADHSYVGVAEELEAIRRRAILDGIESEQSLLDALLLTVHESDTGRVTEFLDVSDVTGSRNFGFGVQISSDFAQEVTLEVFEVTGLDADGNGTFTVAIPGDGS